ncbi:MAG: STAS domain-containing protein [Terracidiphilus sp.]|jgi:anti-anti-sigma factor
MTPRHRAVAVKQLPETFDAQQGRRFFGELESALNVDRPSLVLDCSRVRLLDTSAVHLLLCCLEEAMKRNGDVKLAAVPAGATAVLELSGIDRLFEIYDTCAEAVNSFRRLPMDLASVVSRGPSSHRQSENAA